MRYFTLFLSILASISGVSLSGSADATSSGTYRVDPQDARIQLDAPALAPMAYARFCLEYRDDCAVHPMRSAIGLKRQRWAELVRVNADVNRAIVPQPNHEGVLAERWLVSPEAGDCHDYAVTKRHELLARGWPSRAVLLAEVVTSWGDHHLVLVIRTRDGDFIADNLNANIRRWYTGRYRWVRMQSPENPMFWSTVADVATLAHESAQANSISSAAQSDILVEADETEAAMAAIEPPSQDEATDIPPTNPAPGDERLTPQARHEAPAVVAPGIVDAPTLLEDNAVAEKADNLIKRQAGFGATANVFATDDLTPTKSVRVATEAIIRFSRAASVLWKRQIVRLLSIGGFSSMA